MKKKRYAKDPLLYIHQPTISKPDAPMQDNYQTPRRDKKNPLQAPPPQSNTSQKSRIKRRNPYLKELQQDKNKIHSEDTDEENEKDVSTEPSDESKHHSNRAKFKDMTLEEKVNYFVNLPTHVPKLKCEVQTSERKHRGIITDFKEDLVYIRIGRRTTSRSIPFDDIKDIRLLGF
ncbi:CotO family spore coat protein [Virgibacillus alimentarius]|uniref:CotO family spore coat protein n=1 Tax=Virgibacillus alimentarius TaxID=698769 RepID=UPI0004939A0E|nr:CotO family spore coat protein [Virgibacillus alimentarius]